MRSILNILTLLTTLNVFGQLPSYVPAQGLIGYLSFSGNANDASINNNHGTVNGAQLTSDRHGQASSAYSFDGLSSSIVVPYNATQTPISEFTFSGWVKNTTATDHQSIFLRQGGEGTSWDKTWILRMQNSRDIRV